MNDFITRFQSIRGSNLLILLVIVCFTFSLLTSSPSLANEADKNIGQRIDDYPLIPFNTNFWNYWDHYWMTWLDGHPVYEAIELTAFDNPDNPDYKLLRVFLSEKTGRKKQYFYLNDRAAVARSRANSFYTDITYIRSGKEANPQDLFLQFIDKDNQLIRWNVNFRKEQKLRKHLKGLTPSIHSIGYILLYHLRLNTVSTVDDSVFFNDVDFSFKSNQPELKGKKSWYNKGIYSAVVIFGSLDFTIEDERISNNWGRVFTPVSSDKFLYKSNLLAKENKIEFRVDDKNQLAYYQQESFDHSFRFSFNPALPNRATAIHSQKIEFTVSFDDHDNLSRGYIIVEKKNGKIIYNWHNEAPGWAKNRPFRSLFTFSEKGYNLTTSELPNNKSGALN